MFPYSHKAHMIILSVCVFLSPPKGIWTYWTIPIKFERGLRSLPVGEVFVILKEISHLLTLWKISEWKNNPFQVKKQVRSDGLKLLLKHDLVLLKIKQDQATKQNRASVSVDYYLQPCFWRNIGLILSCLSSFDLLNFCSLCSHTHPSQWLTDYDVSGRILTSFPFP